MKEDIEDAVTPQSTTQEVLKSVLTKPNESSKKYQITIVGLKLLAGGFIVGALLCFIKPSLAMSITTLTQIFLTAVGGLVSVYLGGQSASEWKASAALAATNVDEDKTETKNVNVTIKTPKSSQFDDIP